jgi:hypothetical protein
VSYGDIGGGAPDGGRSSSGGSGGSIVSGGPSTIGISKIRTTIAVRMIAAIMMDVYMKVFVIDISILSFPSSIMRRRLDVCNKRITFFGHFFLQF